MPVVYYYPTAASMYVKFDNTGNTVVNMTEGTGLKKQRYVAADSAIASAVLPAGTYTAAIVIGDYTSPGATDAIIASISRFKWDGTNEVDETNSILSSLSTIAGDLTTVLSDLTTVLSDLGTITSDLGTVQSSLGTVQSSLDAIASSITGLTNLDNLIDALNALLVDLEQIGDLSQLAAGIQETLTRLIAIQGDGFDDSDSLTQLSTYIQQALLFLEEIEGVGFDTSIASLVQLGQALGIGVAPPNPPSEPPPPPNSPAGIPVSDIFNVSGSQIPVNYSTIGSSSSVTSIRNNKSGTLYLQPTQRITIETARLIASQIINYKNEGLIEVFPRVVPLPT